MSDLHLHITRDDDEVQRTVNPRFRVHDLHTDLIGKIAKPTLFGVELAGKYKEMFGIGPSKWHAERTHFFCTRGGPYEMALMFIDEPPVTRNGVTWYILEEVGVDVMGDWHMYTLDQLIICD
jgi:hypothetical protein